MRTKIALSMMVILFVIATSLGATMAWFTAEANIEQNTFEAGTVSLDAVDNFLDETTNTLQNWNPGDCEPKVITIEYTGSKEAFLRMQFIEKWEGVNGDVDGEYYEFDAPQVEKTGWNPANWVFVDGWWYYNSGETDNKSTVVNGSTIYAVDSDFNGDPITVLTEVCLPGSTTGNEYQGATYTINAKFQAIQASYEDQWEWDNVNFETGLEN